MINDINFLHEQIIKLKEENSKLKKQNNKLSVINKEILRELREFKMFNNMLKKKS